MHWSEKYIGQPYVAGSADCAHLLSQVRREQFHLPVPDAVDIERQASRLGRTGQMQDLIGAYGQRTETPQEGDAVLMICAGRPSHVGVFCLIQDEPYVLHAMQNAKMVVLHKIRDLGRVFLKVEGYYRWK